MLAIMRIVVLMALLAACAAPQALPPPPVAACPEGRQQAVLADAFFGRNIGPRLGVTQAAWQGFVDAELTPRFPDGISVTDVAGQFRGANGVIVREPSKRLTLVLTDAPAQRAALAAAIAAYKMRFRQESVLVSETPVCVAF
jgi:hypothetical protein